MQQMQNLMKIEIEEEYDDIRIDKVLSAYLTELSRTYIQKLIDNGNVDSLILAFAVVICESKDEI